MFRFIQGFGSPLFRPGSLDPVWVYGHGTSLFHSCTEKMSVCFWMHTCTLAFKRPIFVHLNSGKFTTNAKTRDFISNDSACSEHLSASLPRNLWVLQYLPFHFELIFTLFLYSVKAFAPPPHPAFYSSYDYFFLLCTNSKFYFFPRLTTLAYMLCLFLHLPLIVISSVFVPPLSPLSPPC